MRGRLPLCSLLLCAVTVGSVVGQEHGLPEIPIDTFTLANGLFVIVSEAHASPVAAVSVWYRVGASPQEPSANALAHLVEHMALQESENLAAGELDWLVARAGGVHLAGTDADRTAFLEVLPSNRVNLGLWLEAERMHRLVISDAGLQSQLDRVSAERNGELFGRPYGRARLAIDTLATDYAPYKRSVGLATALPQSLDAADLRRFYGRYFTPDNAVLAVAGDVDSGQIRSLVEDFLGSIPRGPGVPPLAPFPASPRTDGERRGEMRDAFASDRLLSMAFTIPGARHDDQHALALLVRVLGAGSSSRLQRALVRGRALASHLSATLNRWLGPGTVSIDVLVAEGVPVAELESALTLELERLASEPVTARELRAALNQWKAAEIASRLSVRSRVEALQRHALYLGDPFRINEELARYESVTTDDIRRVADRYLGADNRTVVITTPTGGARGARE